MLAAARCRVANDPIICYLCIAPIAVFGSLFVLADAARLLSLLGLPDLLVPGLWLILLLGGGLISSAVFYYQSSLRRALMDLMLDQGIRPGVCFECQYFTEGFECVECPNCGAALVVTELPIV